MKTLSEMWQFIDNLSRSGERRAMQSCFKTDADGVMRINRPNRFVLKMPEDDRAEQERELERDEAEEYLPWDADRHEVDRSEE